MDNIFYTNTYVIIDESFCLVIDPGFSYNEVIKYLEENNIKLEGILATHGHIDHVVGVKPLRDLFNVEFYMNPRDYGIMNKIDFSYLGVKNISGPKPDKELYDGYVKVGRFRLRVLETPGHTPGSVTLIYGDIAFTGDTLFKESIGRTDLGGDIDMLVRSIHDKLFMLSKDVIVYPGHGEYTTIGYEILNNPYVGLNGIYPFKKDS